MDGISGKTNGSSCQWAALPEPFNFYRLVLKSDHLHFGFWPDHSSDADLEKAQEHMFDLLLSFLPDPPADVLDVGCGLGLSASILARKGYRVTAIAPSSELIAYARQNYADSGADFQSAGFLDDTAPAFAENTYDVILFQESFQYLHPIDAAVRRARTLLRDEGKVIIGDEVCRDRSIQGQTAAHHRQDWTVTLAEQGLQILSRLEIQDRVRLTCNHIIEKFSTHFDDICRAVNTDSAGERLEFFLNGWKNQLSWYTRGQMGYEIIICRKDDIFIREYRNQDEDQILPVFRKIFSNPRTIAHWYWKYRDNPYGQYQIMVAAAENGELAAHFAGYPVMFHSSMTRSDFRSIQAGDTMTSPAFRSRGRGPTSLLVRIANCFYDKFCQGTVPFIYGFNTGTIRKFGERFLQYEYLPSVNYHVRDADMARTGFWERIFLRCKGVRVCEIHSGCPELDRFFHRVSRHYGLLVKRDGRYLQWRYLDCPDRVHRLVVAFRRRRITGLGVFSLRGETLIWGDALCDPEYLRDMAVVLEHAVATFKKTSPVTRIAAWFSPVPEWWHSAMKILGFSIIDEPDHLSPCFKFFNREFSTDDFKKNLYYTMGDSDLF